MVSDDKKFVFDDFAISSTNEQKRSTLVSSSGASTSSKTQMGAGFERNTANKRDNAVSACSPPDNKLRCCNFFPGGLAKISNPACNGSFSSVNFKIRL